MKEKFYIGGKQYIPEESFLLCDAIISEGGLEVFEDNIHERIYATKKGGFFHVHEEKGNVTAEVLSREEVMELLDTFSPYIDTLMYDTVFGAPEIG